MAIKQTIENIHEVYQKLDPNGDYDFGWTQYNYNEFVFGIEKNGKVWYQSDNQLDYLTTVLEIFSDIINERG